MAKRTIWQVPYLHYEEDFGVERRTSWLELYYDLFLVAAIAQLSVALQSNISLQGLMCYASLFIAVFWQWNGWVFYIERFETSGIENRLLFFCQMLPLAGMAVFAQDGFGAHFEGYMLSYVAGRLFITFLWLRAAYHVPAFRPAGYRLVLGYLLGLGVVASSLFFPEVRYALFTGGLLIEILTPLTTIEQQRLLPQMSSSRRPERFGLFIIILLGESVIAVVQGLARSQATKSAIDLTTILPAIVGTALSFGLWWIYFDFVARRPPKPIVLIGALWMYAHLVLAMSIGGVGVGILSVILGRETVSPAAQTLLCGALGVALVDIGLLEMLLRRTPNEPTHRGWSEALKLGSGAVSFAVLLLPVAWKPLPLLAVLFCCLLPSMAYGTWVWYNQDVDENAATI
jgi:low temperature requirement protein LtrA